MPIYTDLQVFKSFLKCASDSADLILRGSLIHSHDANIVKPYLVARPEAIVFYVVKRTKYITEPTLKVTEKKLRLKSKPK